jgi:two-component system response regulator CpxR
MSDIRVLVVDDEPAFVEILAKRLDRRGFAVYTAFRGEEALALLREHEVDVVILDVLMPGMNGVQTLQQIKPRHPLVEVVMLSGNATLGIAIEGMQNGAFDFLVKPAEIADLVEKINKAYARKIEQEERIRKAGFIREQLQEGTPAMSEYDPETTHCRLLVLGRHSDFSHDLVEYALQMSKRMSYEILALSAAGFDGQSFRLFPDARKRVCEDFEEISKKNAAVFERAARKEGVPFAHRVKFCDRDEAIEEIVREVGEIDYVVSEAEEEPREAKRHGKIFAYCPA